MIERPKAKTKREKDFDRDAEKAKQKVIARAKKNGVLRY